MRRLFRAIACRRAWQSRENDALLQAAFNDRLEVFDVLLRDKRVDPAAANNQAVSKVAENDNIETLDCLLQASRSIGQEQYSCALCRKEWPRANCRMAAAGPASRSDRQRKRSDRLGGAPRQHARCHTHRQAVARLLANALVLSAIDDNVFSLGCSLRTRFASVCVGLHGLGLLALVQLEIVDALISTTFAWPPWDLIIKYCCRPIVSRSS